ncbi:MAG: hypothetical protein M3P98_04305 [bacterium]|nr:hypothetical protein [bacterium]
MSKVIPHRTLDQVALEFKAWRESKSYTRGITPEHLWELVRIIEPYYPRRKIEVALSITKEQLDRRAPMTVPCIQQNNSVDCTEMKFVELSVPVMPDQVHVASTLTIKIGRNDGTSLSIEQVTSSFALESLYLFLGR